jgi:glutamate dehydrogenase (NAD(P)+)
LLEAASRTGSRLPESFPGRRIPPEEVLESEVEYLFPCARHHAIHGGNVAAIRAPVISPAANAACTLPAEEELLRRGVFCLPDFVANAGGVLGGTMEFAGIKPPRVTELIESWMADVVRSLWTAAARDGRAPRDLAEEFALRRHAGIQEEAANPTFARRIIGWGVRLHRAAIAPEPLVRRLAERHFERLVAEIRF